jgi:TonB family protein
MNSSVWLANLEAWWLQAGVITALAAVLLRMMPVRAPGAVLLYLQALLGVCLLLPVLEPWRAAAAVSRIYVGASSTLRVSGLATVPVSTQTLVWVLLGAGMAFRLIWLGLGYWRLCRYRRDAWPAGPEIAALQKTLGVRAEVSVSGEISGPVTFGFARRTILLPTRWPDLDPASRTAIACHELLHVRRNDWAWHAAEEIIRALVWFHPAIWWLTAEIRLAREQVVDRLAANVTRGPKAYAEVLLAFAGVDCGTAAPAFLRKGHLARRVQSVLEEVTMTKSRLLVSLASITLCLVVTGAIAVWAFPLESVESTFIVQDDSAPAAGVAGSVIGGVPGGVVGGVIGGVVGGVPGARSVAAEGQADEVFKAGEKGVTAPRVLSKVDPAYTKEARDAEIEGTVVLRLEVHPDGRAHNITVERSLEPGLDHNAIEAVSQWKFQPGQKDGKLVAVAAKIEINYKLK